MTEDQFFDYLKNLAAGYRPIIYHHPGAKVIRILNIQDFCFCPITYVAQMSGTQINAAMSAAYFVGVRMGLGAQLSMDLVAAADDAIGAGYYEKEMTRLREKLIKTLELKK